MALIGVLGPGFLFLLGFLVHFPQQSITTNFLETLPHKKTKEISEEYSEPCQSSKMEHFGKIVNS